MRVRPLLAPIKANAMRVKGNKFHEIINSTESGNNSRASECIKHSNNVRRVENNESARNILNAKSTKHPHRICARNPHRLCPPS